MPGKVLLTAVFKRTESPWFLVSIVILRIIVLSAPVAGMRLFLIVAKKVNRKDNK